MTKYIFVTGGVVSGLGKGITAASLGRLLKSRGLKVAAQKLDESRLGQAKEASGQPGPVILRSGLERRVKDRAFSAAELVDQRRLADPAPAIDDGELKFAAVVHFI